MIYTDFNHRDDDDDDDDDIKGHFHYLTCVGCIQNDLLSNAAQQEMNA